MHYFKRNIGDYHKKAGRLSMLEHGSYTLLLDACYDRERFPTMEEAIDWCWARGEAEVAAVAFVLEKFFTLVDGRYVQARIQDEITAYKAIALKNKEIAEKREDKRTKRAADSTKRAPLVHEPAPNQEPLTTNQETKDQDQKICAATAAPAPVENPAAIIVTDQPKASRGTRLPTDWTLPEAWREWANTNRPDISVELEADKFRDHWHAAPGAKATKADWLATWRNWVRNASAPRNVHAFPSKSRYTNLPQVNADEIRAKTEENQRLGNAVQISKFGAQPRVKARPDTCEVHGPFERKLVESFDGENHVLGCPNCLWEAVNTAPTDSEAHAKAVELKRWDSLNERLFATGVALRFRRCSLENYTTAEPGQVEALNACRAYVDQFEECIDAGRCLLMLGNFGNGKTHLGCSILKAVVTRYSYSALYAPAPDIIAALKASYAKGSSDTEQSILNDLSTVDLLLIDELGAQSGTEFERHSLHTIIDKRYRAMLPTIITSNLPSSELADYIGDRALDRLRENGGEAIAFTWASHRGGEV